MKKYRVCGFSKYSGEFEGRAYSGYYVSCVSLDDPGKGFEGQRVKDLKVKERVGYIPCVGDEILVTYGEYGIEEIERVF